MSGSAAAARRSPVFLQGELLPDAITISPTASWRMLLTPCVSQPTCSALITVSPCVNKYPGVDRSSVPVLHHQGVQSGGRPLLSCSRADRNHDYTVSTVVIHLLPKLRHHTPSYAPTHKHSYTHIQKKEHTPTDKQMLTDIWSFIPIIFFSSVLPVVLATCCPCCHLHSANIPAAMFGDCKLLLFVRVHNTKHLIMHNIKTCCFEIH